MQDFDSDDEDSSPSCIPSLTDSYHTSSEDYSSADSNGEESSPLYDRKFLVFEKNLDGLFRRCQRCGSCIKRKRKSTVWSLLEVTTCCENGHQRTWRSQPMLGCAPAGNILLASAILNSGCLFSTFQLLSSLLNLMVICKTSYYKMQRHMLYPVIHQAWSDHAASLRLIATGETLKFRGNGRCDSPGYSAKFCTYTLLEMTSGLIFDFELMHVAKSGRSVAIERDGLRQILLRLQEAPFVVGQLATDRSSTIKAMLQHDFD